MDEGSSMELLAYFTLIGAASKILHLPNLFLRATLTYIYIYIFREEISV